MLIQRQITRWNYWCPACQGIHQVSDLWGYNNNPAKPTFTPSVKVEDYKDGICHHYVTNGQIQFLSDCTHDMKNKTVPMVDIPDEWLYVG